MFCTNGESSRQYFECPSGDKKFNNELSLLLRDTSFGGFSSCFEFSPGSAEVGGSMEGFG
jgi:hypothetical protein